MLEGKGEGGLGCSERYEEEELGVGGRGVMFGSESSEREAA